MYAALWVSGLSARGGHQRALWGGSMAFAPRHVLRWLLTLGTPSPAELAFGSFSGPAPPENYLAIRYSDGLLAETR